jgi:hypothetical protein
MKVNDLTTLSQFFIVSEGSHMEDEVTAPFCCDLLSIAMNHAPAGCAWVTVMANVNTLAVASLADAACIILAAGVRLDVEAERRAKEEGITVLRTDLMIFDAAMEVYNLIHV